VPTSPLVSAGTALAEVRGVRLGMFPRHPESGGRRERRDHGDGAAEAERVGDQAGDEATSDAPRVAPEVMYAHHRRSPLGRSPLRVIMEGVAITRGLRYCEGFDG
jgi:hypothetical protein